MKTLAKYNVCNHCVVGEKTGLLDIYLSGPVSYRDFRATGPWGNKTCLIKPGLTKWNFLTESWTTDFDIGFK